MDILTIILACSLHPDDQLLRALVEVQSRGNLFFVGDLATLKTSDSITTLEDAKRVVAQIQRDRGRAAVGLLGVPIEWAARFGRNPTDLFDGCTNVEIATSVLSAHDRECRQPPRSRVRKGRSRVPVRMPVELTRECALRRYGAELGITNFAEEVLKVVAVKAAHRDDDPDSDPAPQRSPVFVDGADDVPANEKKNPSWSSPRLFGSEVAEGVLLGQSPSRTAPPARRQ